MKRRITDARMGLCDTGRSGFGAVCLSSLLSVIFYVASRAETTASMKFCAAQTERLDGM
jgi:hypothetical protein